MQPTVFDFLNPSLAAKRRQMTCSDDDLAILSAFASGKLGLQLGKLPPHSRLSIPVLRDTVGFTHGYLSFAAFAAEYRFSRWGKSATRLPVAR